MATELSTQHAGSVRLFSAAIVGSCGKLTRWDKEAKNIELETLKE